MFAKSLIAAAAVVSSLVAVAPQQANADVDFNVGVNLGHPGFYPGYGYGSGYGYGNGYGYGYGNGYGYGYQPVHPIYAPSTISCYQGKKTVRWSGFHNVQAIDCQGSSYRYNARKNGHFYRVTVSAFSGQIVKVRPYAVY